MQHLKLKEALTKTGISFIIVAMTLNIMISNKSYASKTDLENYLTAYGQQNSGYFGIENYTDNVWSKLSAVKGFKDVKYENGQLTIIYDGAYGKETVRGDIENAFAGGIGGWTDATDILFGNTKVEPDQTTPSNPNNPDQPTTPLTEEEQFKQNVGNNYKIPTSSVDELWNQYKNGELGPDGNPKVIVTKDSAGNITDVKFNMDQQQMQDMGISDSTQTQITNDKNSINSDLEGSEQYEWGGVLMKPITSFITGIGSACNMLLERIFMDEPAEIWIDTGWLKGNHDVAAFIAENSDVGGLEEVHVVRDYTKTLMGKYGVPNVKLTSAEIFAGNVAALDANFFDDGDYSNSLGGEEKSIVLKLKETISKWYVALRNIAVVGLLSVLLYIGIRIVISSSNADKAKYKQFFVDWIIALCLIFFLHYIMAFTMTMTKTLTNVFAGSTTEEGTIKQVAIGLTDESDSVIEGPFASNFTGVALLKAHYQAQGLALGYSIMYLALTIYTVYFAFVYLKRLLMLAFLTMIAPLVALTYPLDKIKDGKAQAFNFWLKEYMFYALLQPLHMLLYTVFVSSALAIAAKNLIYAIVAMAFIVPAEKIMKQMFGIKGQTESAIGGFAGGALAAQAFNALKGNMAKNKNANAQQQKKIRFKNPNTPNPATTLAGEAEGVNPALAVGAGAAAAAGAGASGFTDEQRATAEANLEAVNGHEELLSREDRAALGLDGALNGNPNDTASLPQPNNQQIEQQNSQRNSQQAQAQRQLQTENANTVKAHRQKLWNNAKIAAKKRYLAAGGGKGIAMKALKGAGRAYGTAALAGVGLAAGMVGGDLGDMWKGMAAGAGAGAVVSNKATNMAGNAYGSTRNLANEVLKGQEGAGKTQFMSQYMNDPANASRILEDNPNMKISEIRQRQQQEAQMIYDSGIDDYSTIKGAVKLEDTGSSHDYAVAIAKLSQNYEKNVFLDNNKFEQAQKALAKKLEKQMNENLEAQIKQTLEKEISSGKHKDMSASDRAIETQKRLTAQSADVSKKANTQATQTLNDIKRMKKL